MLLSGQRCKADPEEKGTESVSRTSRSEPDKSCKADPEEKGTESFFRSCGVAVIIFCVARRIPRKRELKAHAPLPPGACAHVARRIPRKRELKAPHLYSLSNVQRVARRIPRKRELKAVFSKLLAYISRRVARRIPRKRELKAGEKER